jgi:Arc/MetJ-type ribon-helix-helix transcriptional regulator
MPELDKSRKKRSIAIRLDLCQWVEEQIGKGRFHNVSHAVEIAIDGLRESEKEKRK